VSVIGLAQVGQAGPGDDESPTGVDLLHQVEALDLKVSHRREVDRARVVDDDVDSAPAADRLRNGVRDLLGVADVAHDRQRLAALGLDLRGSGVDRPRQLRVRLGGLRQQRHPGAVAREPLGDCQADAAASPGHEDDSL
jgi:hypothetical protein